MVGGGSQNWPTFARFLAPGAIRRCFHRLGPRRQSCLTVVTRAATQMPLRVSPVRAWPDPPSSVGVNRSVGSQPAKLPLKHPHRSLRCQSLLSTSCQQPTGTPIDNCRSQAELGLPPVVGLTRGPTQMNPEPFRNPNHKRWSQHCKTGVFIADCK